MLRDPAGFPDSLAPCPAFGVAAGREVSLGSQRNAMLRAPRVMALLRLCTGCAKPGHPGGTFSLMSPSTLPHSCPWCSMGCPPWNMSGFRHQTNLFLHTHFAPHLHPSTSTLGGWRTPTQSDCGSNLSFSCKRPALLANNKK